MNALVARVLAGVTVVSAVAVLAGPAPATVAGGLLLALVLPGLALSAALFHGRTLSAIERTALAPALSLAVLVISGLIMYASGYALNRTSWTAATTSVTLLALVVPAIVMPRVAKKLAAAEATDLRIAALAAAAKQAVEDSMRPVGEQRIRITPGAGTGTSTVVLPVPPVVGEKPPLKRIARQLMPMVLVLAMLGSAGWLSFVSAQHNYDATVTALSAAPPGATDAAGRRTVKVTASGLVAADGPYRIAVLITGGATTDARTVPVRASGTWTANLSVGRDRTTVNLYRARDTTAYRTLYISADG